MVKGVKCWIVDGGFCTKYAPTKYLDVYGFFPRGAFLFEPLYELRPRAINAYVSKVIVGHVHDDILLG